MKRALQPIVLFLAVVNIQALLANSMAVGKEMFKICLQPLNTTLIGVLLQRQLEFPVQMPLQAQILEIRKLLRNNPTAVLW